MLVFYEFSNNCRITLDIKAKKTYKKRFQFLIIMLL